MVICRIVHAQDLKVLKVLKVFGSAETFAETSSAQVYKKVSAFTGMLIAPTPPRQRVERPSLFFLFLKACMSVTRTRAPLAPIGGPRAMAPPWTFTFAGSIFSSFITASVWAENASFSSMRSKSRILSPVFLRRFFIDTKGARVYHFG